MSGKTRRGYLVEKFTGIWLIWPEVVNNWVTDFFLRYKKMGTFENWWMIQVIYNHDNFTSNMEYYLKVWLHFLSWRSETGAGRAGVSPLPSPPPSAWPWQSPVSGCPSQPQGAGYPSTPCQEAARQCLALSRELDTEASAQLLNYKTSHFFDSPKILWRQIFREIIGYCRQTTQ